MSIQLLHLDSSILGAHSVSRLLSASVVERLQDMHPDLQVTYRDLAETPIPHLSGPYLAAGRSAEPHQDPVLRSNLALGNAVLEEFLAADIVVIGVAFYNFSVSSQLKAWVDRIAVAGRTFRYSERGVEGLAGGKRVILAISRGGFYGEGQPTRAFEHAESYLRGVFGFIGITQLEVVAAEGVAVGEEQRKAAIAQARRQIETLAA
jgi:FMN-dependent NADH-azoreductase